MQISLYDLWNKGSGNSLASKHMGHIVTDLLSRLTDSGQQRKYMKKAKADNEERCVTDA